MWRRRMSSTNRGHTRYDHRCDYYTTPQAKIHEVLKPLLELEPDLLRGPVLDPCAGGDAVHEMSYPVVLRQYGVNDIDTIDIRDDSRAALKADYLTTDCAGRYRLIITNPPFALAEEVIEKALQDVLPGGFVVMLLRLNFFGGKKRLSFWRRHMPKWALVHHRRMSFCLNKRGRPGMDSIEYMHAVWQQGLHPPFTRLLVI